MRPYQPPGRARFNTVVLIGECLPGSLRACDEVVDPVCGIPLDPATAAFHVKFGKQDFHFCSVHCQQEFLADQAGFLKAAPRAANAPCAAIEGRYYICSLNPRFVCNAPGTYPHCGMVLESVQSPVDGANPEPDDSC